MYDYIDLKTKFYEEELRKAYLDIYCFLLSEEKDLFDSKLILLEDYVQILRKRLDELEKMSI